MPFISFSTNEVRRNGAIQIILMANPLRVQRNMDFAKITLAPLANVLLTPTSPSPEREEATKPHSVQEEFGGEGGDDGSYHSSPPPPFSDRGKDTGSTVPADWMVQKLRDPNKHMNLDLLRISQMCESNNWKSTVYLAIESYLIEQDHYLIDIPERDFVKWERDKKKKLLRLLETCKAAFIRECEARTDRQSLITTFFRRIDPT
jgi:hypothetical protein